MIKHLLLSFMVCMPNLLWAGSSSVVSSSVKTNSAPATASTEVSPAGPGMEYVCELRVKCSAAINVGTTSHGKRVIIPIVGGTFSGPKMKGEIIPGGADHQYVDEGHERTELEAIYTIRTDDGVYIHVRNCGILKMTINKDGGKDMYFRTAPKFEAPSDGKYGWLNDAIYVCVPSFDQGLICLKVWKIL